MEKQVIKVVSVKINKDIDECPTFEGHYSNTDEGNRFAIERRNAGHGEYKYFIPPSENYEGDTEDNIKRYCYQDYKRMEAYNSGQWFYMGITAEAEVMYSIGNGCNRLEHLTSSGLWGVASDDDSGEILSTVQDQVANLKEHLAVFGVDLSNFDELAEQAVSKS